MPSSSWRYHEPTDPPSNKPPGGGPTALRLARALRLVRRHRPIAALLALPVAAALVVSLLAVSADAETTSGVIQAEAFSAQSGAQVENTIDTGGGQNMSWLANGDWLRYNAVNLGQPGTLTTSIRVSDGGTVGGTVELRAGSLTGTLLASVAITPTGGWQTWITKTATTQSTLSGAHDVYLVLHSTQSADFVNINWFSLTGAGTASPTGMPSMSMPPGSPMPSSVPGQWISVDPVAQAAATAAFFARVPKPITGNPVHVPEFNAGCTVSHHAPDDPIVFPGQFGASHNHTFIGNTTTNAVSTTASLLAGGTTCTPAEDRSAYWVPTLYQNGTVVDPSGVTVYYGSRLADPSRTQPFPLGLRMLTGDAKQQVDTPDHQGNHFFCAGIGGEVGRTADGTFPICAPTAVLNRQITFPDCWDGVHLDSPDHKAHMSNAVNGTCPAAFPVPIPSVSYVIAYPLSTNTSGITLASGTSFSMHADFFNAWEVNAQAERVRNCLDQGVKCNSAGNF